jgi:adenine C2-methylase RlmN of 23S rRNA A2503 and tRNA A37
VLQCRTYKVLRSITHSFLLLGDTNGPRLIAKFTTGSETLQSGWSGDVSSQQGCAVACAFNTPKLTLHLRSRALQVHEEGQNGHGRRERATLTKSERVKLHVVLSQE